MTAAAFVSTASVITAQSLESGMTMQHTLEAAGLKRSYNLHVPAALPGDKPAALVLVFHGSGDTGSGMEAFSKFSKLSDREKFIVAYPDAIGKNWNDGREVTCISSQLNKVDDVAFAAAMIKDVSATQRVDAKRIFAAGFSNGGIFVHLLAARLGKQLAAVAAVSGGIAEPLAPKFNPVAPVSIFIMHGTKDPFVPYLGGAVDYCNNGRIISTADAVACWLKANGAEGKPDTGELPDRVAADNCQVKWSRWISKKSGAELLLYMIDGAGHTWASGSQYLPVPVIGEVCREFNATESIWSFFEKHPRP
ncbi:MAG: dienelactone hydrolase family protein [Verrucomicrobia bacterium]|nr:dienelactone hydrolase family protein [Verrucomicrobiota bacterium]